MWLKLPILVWAAHLAYRCEIIRMKLLRCGIERRKFYLVLNVIRAMWTSGPLDVYSLKWQLVSHYSKVIRKLINCSVCSGKWIFIFPPNKFYFPAHQFQFAYISEILLIKYLIGVTWLLFFLCLAFWKLQLRIFGQVWPNWICIKWHSHAGHKSNYANKWKWSIALAMICSIQCFIIIQFIVYQQSEFWNTNILMASNWTNWFRLS